ncbi:MAG TPA: YIP1 family protein [Ruminiclostridium sp.]|nr:YIP1 family protein [Ruminiclostridium sp.]
MEDSKKMTFWGRVLGMYIHPVRVIEDLKQRTSIIFPFLLLLLAQPAYYLIRYPAYLRFMEGITGTHDSSALTKLAVNGVITRGVGLVAGWLVGSLLMFGFTKLVGGQGTLKQLLTANGYAYLAIIPMLIIMGIAGVFTGELLINFSPAVFIPQLRGTTLYGILRFFCAFFVWQHVLMVVGFYKVSNTTKLKSIFIVVIIMVIEFFVNFPMLKNM